MLSNVEKLIKNLELVKKSVKHNFFFVNHFGRSTCLICNESIAVNKEYNIKRHYESKHKMFFTSYLT